MGFTIAYLKQRMKQLIVFITFAIVYAVVFTLYQIPVDTVIYATILCTFLGILIVVIDYMLYLRQHLKVKKLQNEITITMEHMPSPRAVIENDYQRVIEELYDSKLSMFNEQERRYADIVDYYTVWVHQIKTPIAAMRLLLQNGEFEGRAEVERELQRIEQYVDMVLCYLRLESEQTDYVFKEYSLDGIVRQAVRKYAPQFIHKKIRLVYEGTECSVLTDEKWLLFVIEQILGNSLKYTMKGSITIYVEEPKILCIKDTGIGIAEEDINRVFEKGYTGYNGRKDKKATGIGLYLCRQIMNRLGHGISIESVPGEGTTVKLELNTEKLEIYS